MAESTWATVIAGVALFVSIAAAVFSWKSAAHAKKANAIAIHHYQKDLHHAFLEVRKLLGSKSLLLKQDELRPYGLYFKTAPLYISASLANRLLDFYDECLQIEELHELLIMARDYSRLVVNAPTFLDGDDLPNMQKSANLSVANARENLSGCVERASEMAEKLETLLISELKI